MKRNQAESKFAQDFGAGLSHFRVYTKTMYDLEGKPAYVVEWVDGGEKVQSVKSSMETVAHSIAEQSIAVDEIAKNAISVSTKTEEMNKAVNTMQKGVNEVRKKLN